ncbi:MAG TPA: hypothetical protein VK088_08830 [Acidimicrobiia bacterium]|nr:hypothetical protein [Acidimicrobiia bacterium]
MSLPPITHWNIRHDGAGRIDVTFGLVATNPGDPRSLSFSVPHHCVLSIIGSLTKAAAEVKGWHEENDRLLAFTPIDHHDDE